MPAPFILGGVAAVVAAGFYMKHRNRQKMLAAMSPEERSAFLAAEDDARRAKQNQRREELYTAAIAEAQKWCLMAMRESRHYTRVWVADAEIDDVRLWAEANGIAVTEMVREPGKARYSFGGLQKAKARARFMGEEV